MFTWILLITSGLVLGLILFRRLRLTQKDLHFQEKLRREESGDLLLDEPEELAVESAEALPNGFLTGEQSSAPTPTDLPELEGGVRKSFQRAEVFFSRNQLDEAEPLLLAILLEEPSHLNANHKLGLLYLKRGDYPKAELYFSKLVNLKQDPVYFSNLGAALYQQQRLVEAAEAYENAIALDDRRAERLQSLAQVYFELGEDERALHYFERAARRKPKDEDLKLILADYYERLGDRVRARKMLEELLEMDPYNAELKERLTLLLPNT